MAKQVTLKGRLDWDNSSLKRGMKEATAASKKFAANFKSSMAFATGAAGAGGLSLGLKQAADQFDRIGKLAKRFKIDSGFLVNLNKTAKLSGTNLERVADAMKDLQKNIGQAKLGDQNIRDAFGGLGIDFERFSRMRPAEQFAEMARVLATAKDQQIALAHGTKIMGESISELMPLMREWREIQEDLRRNPLVNPRDIQNIEKLNDQWTKVKSTLLEVSGLTLSILQQFGQMWVQQNNVVGKLKGDKARVDAKQREAARAKGPPEATLPRPSSGNFGNLDAFINMQRRKSGDMRFARGGKFKFQRHFFAENDPVFGRHRLSADPSARFKEPFKFNRVGKPLVTSEGGPLAGAHFLSSGQGVEGASGLSRGRKREGLRGPLAIHSLRGDVQRRIKAEQAAKAQQKSPEEILQGIEKNTERTAEALE